jgi:predicted porin
VSKSAVPFLALKTTSGDTMKTYHPLLAAALATFAGAAAAQSSVAVFGTLDLMATQMKGSTTGVNATDTSIHKVEGGGMSTSNLGFRGIEDLGGGLAASFELAAFLRPDTGLPGRSDAVGPPVNVAADPFFSRASWVGLSSSSFGRVRLGNASSLMFLTSITSNAFGDSVVFSPLNLITFIGSPLTGGTGWTNQAIYDSPVIGGFSASAAYSASEGQGGHNAAGRLSYANGPFSTSFAYQTVKKNPLTFADGTSPNNTKSWLLAAAYDFKVVKLFGHVGRIQNEGTEAAPLNVRYNLWELSASIPAGPGRVLAGYASRKTNDAVGPVPAAVAGGNKERQVFSIGYDYLLSKRTDLYLMMSHDRTVTNVLPVPPQLVTATGTNFGVGIRHSF